jgi:hypothetical protein
MSYDRMGPRIEELEDQVAGMLAEAEATDLAEAWSSPTKPDNLYAAS